MIFLDIVATAGSFITKAREQILYKLHPPNFMPSTDFKNFLEQHAINTC